MKEEEARELYWEAVGNLNEIISSGVESRKEIFEELENDLESK